MSKQKAMGYSPYFLKFGIDPIFQSRFQYLEEEELDLAAATTQLQVFLDRREPKFREVMPLAMRRLAVA